MVKAEGLFGTPREWAQDLAIATGIGAFLGVIGPFGSFNGAGLEVRLFYWIANLWIGFVMLSVIVRLSLKAGSRLDLPVWFALPVGTAIGALPLGFTIAVFSAVAWPPNHGRISALGVWYVQTLALSLPCSLFYYFMTGRAGRYTARYTLGRGGGDAEASAACSTDDAAANREPGDTPRLIARLPARLGQTLLCLQMEDHYVRAHTDRGSDLILIPLKTAISEMEPVEGMQVHRSWWVARTAFERAVWEGRNLRLRLVNGQEVPVSRSSVAPLRANRWLDGDSTP
jgi:hypothetical protein